MARTVSLYTDGSSDGKGAGGYAAIVRCGKFQKVVMGRTSHGKINKLELRAAIEGIKVIKPHSIVRLYTDSQHLSKAFNEGLIQKWQENGWKRFRTGEPIQNKALFLELIDEAKKRDLKLEFHKIAAHKGNKFNELADSLAKAAMKNISPKRALNTMKM